MDIQDSVSNSSITHKIIISYLMMRQGIITPLMLCSRRLLNCCLHPHNNLNFKSTTRNAWNCSERFFEDESMLVGSKLIRTTEPLKDLLQAQVHIVQTHTFDNDLNNFDACPAIVKVFVSKPDACRFCLVENLIFSRPQDMDENDGCEMDDENEYESAELAKFMET